MKRPSLYTTHNAIPFAVGCLLLSMGVVTGAHAQEQVRAPAPEAALVTASAAAASINLADPTTQPAQAAARDRELSRAHHMERRMMISESTGISLGEIDDLLRKIGPTAEERDDHERRTQTGQLSVEDPDENP